ncbi:MAG: RNA helicase [Micavibrio sp.]|nr:RNA helicase [Micavibrio sp.]|tara:strand:- start:85451 stop:87967 length:2517 start_codon:yes stop_codon:yes gene_type:complete
MTKFSEKLAKQIVSSEGYKTTSNSLFSAYVSDLISSGRELSRTEVKKLLTSAQVLYSSEDKEFQNEGRILLSMLLDVCAKNYPDIVPVARSMFIDTGNFPNIYLLNKRYPNINFQYNIHLEAQAEFRETLNTIDELDFPLTDFQLSLWTDLISDRDVVTAAPTSAGKTHIILNYLIHKVTRSDGAFAAIIVPTRALISEVAGKIYELIKERDYQSEIEICTVPKEGKFRDKTLFVMTQERLHEVLLRGDIYFDYLFIDEAQNISDKSRGTLLHLTIEKIMEGSLPQIIVSMPSPSYQDSFSSIFSGTEFEKEITSNSPVAKIVMSVVAKNRELIISRYNSTNTINVAKDFTGSKAKLAKIVYRLGKNETNIIYRNKTNHCEDFADQISALITDSKEIDDRLEEAASYIEEFIHKDFSLAKNLRKEVAFHYGPLPSSVRVMIENLVKDNRIKFIACTSTLAEGVNLPAKNLFLSNPIQPVQYASPERLEDVKINNITGRAGRMLSHFSGNIFLIDPDNWHFQDYFEDNSNEEEKIPTYYKTINEEFKLVLDALGGTYNHNERDQYRLYTIANKLIKEFGNDRFENTINAPELTINNSEKNLLARSVQVAHENLKVATFTLEANPTVGYIQQNKLFLFLSSQPNIEEWTLPHPQSANLYEKLLKVCTKLQEAGVYVPTKEYSSKYICSVTKKWIKGESLKDIIVTQIQWDRQYAKESGINPNSINKSVRNVMEVINNDIRFRLSNALKCYQTLLNSVLSSKKLDVSNVKLHSYIEVGACDDRMINLINLGLSREAAKEIHEKLVHSENITTSSNLLQLYNSGKLENIHPITKKEVIELLT